MSFETTYEDSFIKKMRKFGVDKDTGLPSVQIITIIKPFKYKLSEVFLAKGKEWIRKPPERRGRRIIVHGDHDEFQG